MILTEDCTRSISPRMCTSWLNYLDPKESQQLKRKRQGNYSNPDPNSYPYHNPSPNRWEKFAETKGIKKKAKRSRMVYDENIKDWAPRWGAFSVKKNEKEANGGFIELG